MLIYPNLNYFYQILKRKILLVPRTIKGEIITTPSGVDHDFDVWTNEFKLGLTL